MSDRTHRGVYEDPKKPGTFCIHYYDAAGRRHRERIGKYQAAVDAYVERKLQIRSGTFTPPGRKDKTTFLDLLDAALAAKQGRMTTQAYQSDTYRAKPLREAFGHLRAEHVTPELIDQEFQKMRSSGLSGSTVNRYRSLLSSVFSFAVKKGKFPVNPLARVQRYPENDPRVRWLDDDEEKALRRQIKQTDPQREPLFDLALNTGMRRGEQWNLKWDCVDLERAILTVYGKRKPDGRRRRFVPINQPARSALERLHQQSKGSAYVSPRGRSSGERDWSEWFEGCVKMAGLENFTWHDLRHTFASRLAMKGVPLPEIQELLGHTTIMQTRKYAHLSPGHLRSAVDKLATATKQPATRRGRRRKVLKIKRKKAS